MTATSEVVIGGAGWARAPPIIGAFTTMRRLKHRFSPTNNQAQGVSPTNMKTITSLLFRMNRKNVRKCVKEVQLLHQLKTKLTMENIVENHGLSHIGIQIFNHLDNKSLANARLVKISWTNLIDTKLLEKRKKLRIKKTFQFYRINFKKFFEFWPEWKRILEDFRLNRSFEDFQNLNRLMKEYFKKYGNTDVEQKFDPLMFTTIFKSDISTLQLILPSVRSLRFTNRTGQTLLHFAVVYGQTDIVKLIVNEHGHKVDFAQRDGSHRLGSNIFGEAYCRSKEIHTFLKEYAKEHNMLDYHWSLT